jgi:hypothetical protein
MRIYICKTTYFFTYYLTQIFMHLQNQCEGGHCSMGHSHEMGDQPCSCGTGSCPCGCHGMHGDEGMMNPMEELKEAVKAAKKCLLKDKIKDKLEMKIGKKLDKMADLAVDMMMTKWEMKSKMMEKKIGMMEKMESIWDEK